VESTAPVAGILSDNPARPGVVASLIETTKPGITRLVTITSAVGFVMSAVQTRWSAGELALAALGAACGTALSASGANSINQWMERSRDAVMSRTARRPLPQGRVTPGMVLWTGLTLGALGVLTLLATVGWVPALLSLACIVVYVAIYTPLKTRTPWATFVGTIPGALPPLIGWTAASHAGGINALLEPGGLSLFALMTVWQIPHFLAIAWMYRDDYAKGGYRVLPTLERGEQRTVFTITVWALLLVPATLAPGLLMPDSLGVPYLAVAIGAAIAFLVLVSRMVTTRTRDSARNVFLGSIMHLPILLVAMVAVALGRLVF
jgi:protoheme IX farnesyltransferase